MRAFNNATPFADNQYTGDNRTISEAQVESVTSEVTSVDAY
jgi:hypothetical protein